MVGVRLEGSEGRAVNAIRELRAARRDIATAGVGSHAERNGVPKRRAAEHRHAALGEAVTIPDQAKKIPLGLMTTCCSFVQNDSLQDSRL